MCLSFRPTLPVRWKSYRFRVCYQGAILEVRMDKKGAEFRVVSGPAVTVRVYGKKYALDARPIVILPQPAA